MSSPSGSRQHQSIIIPLSKITAPTNDSREIFKGNRSEIRDHQTPSFSARTRRRKLHAHERFDVQNRGVDFALCHHSGVDPTPPTKDEHSPTVTTDHI